MSGALRAFGERFVLPWIAGGDAWVGPPLAPGLLGAWRDLEAIDPDALDATRRAIVDATAPLVPGAPAPWPERGAVALGLAIHDLLWRTDPAATRWPARRALPRVVAWARALLDAVSAPATRGEALVRHAIADPLFTAVRRDVVVRTWAGTHRFAGRAVPGRVVAWPRLRAVRTKAGERRAPELLVETPRRPAGAAAVTAADVARRSPLTALLRGDVLGPPTLDGATLTVLADDRLRGGVARGLLGRPAGALEALSAALDAAPVDPRALGPALALAWELHVAAALGPRTTEPFGAPLLDALLPELAVALPAAQRALRGGDEAAVRARTRAIADAVPPRARATARRIAAGAAAPPPGPGGAPLETTP